MKSKYPDLFSVMWLFQLCEMAESHGKEYGSKGHGHIGYDRDITLWPKSMRDGIVFYCTGWGWRNRIKWRIVFEQRFGLRRAKNGALIMDGRWDEYKRIRREIYGHE